MKLRYLPVLAFLCLLTFTARADEIDGINWLMRNGNTQRIEQFFSPTVELTFMRQQNTLSKRQAAEALDKFFAAHKPTNVKLLHKVNSNHRFLFGVILFNGGGTRYRMSLTLNQEGKNMRVIEMRIEPER